MLPQLSPARTYPTTQLTLQRNLPYTAPCDQTYPTAQPTLQRNLPYTATYPTAHLTTEPNPPHYETYPTAKLTLHRNAPCSGTHPTSKLTLHRNAPCCETYPTARLAQGCCSSPNLPCSKTGTTTHLRPAAGRALTKSPPNLPYNAPATTRPDRNPRAPPLDPPRRVVTGKSRRRRAYPQQIVTTRLLYCLQDPFAQLSRLQRI